MRSDSQSPTSSSDATTSSSQKASESTESRYWPATEGEELFGVMTSVEGRRGHTEVVFQGEEAEITFTQPKNATPKG